MAVSRGVDRNPGHEIQETIAVDVVYLAAEAMGHYKLGHAAIGRRNHLSIPLE